MTDPKEVQVALLALLLIGLFCALLALALQTLLRPGTLLAPQRRRAVPWTGPEVCLAVLVFLLLPGLFGELLRESGFLDRLYGVGFAEALKAKDGLVKALATHRLQFWAYVLSAPFQVWAILHLFRALSGTRPYQLGLTAHRWAANVVLAALAWLVVTPGVFLINLLVNSLIPPEEHPLTHIVQTGQALPVDWFLVVFQAVVAAPVLEELLFRGILQKWFGRRPWGGDVAMAGALLLALLARAGKIHDAIGRRDLEQLAEQSGPALFVLALFPAYLVVARLGARLFPRGGPNASNTVRAWFGTAVLFAAVHSGVWPSPIPLFVLALALGWLAYRTQSLVAPVVLHALFNGVTCLMLILYPTPQAPPPGKGRAITSAPRRTPPASTSRRVPGSWWPRRT